MRNRITTAAVVTFAATLALSGCATGSKSGASSSSGSSSSSSSASGSSSSSGPASSSSAGSASGSSSSAAAAPTGLLTVGRGNGTQTNNSNPFVSTSSTQQLGYGFVVYEPLAQVNIVRPTQAPVPWLATAWKWNANYTQVEFTIRKNVKWSDGQTLTPEDVAYSIGLRKDKEALNSEALPYKSVTTTGSTVTVAFTSPQFVNQFKVLNLFIVPKHIWSKIADPTTDLNQHPVGTGPYALTSWSAQAVTLDARSDYWGGQPKVKTMRFLPYNDNNSFTTALTTGQVQWGQGFIPNIDKIYASKDPAHNKYWFPGGLGIDQLSLNTKTAPFNDVAVRKAVNMVIDRAQISKIAESGIFPELTSVTGLPTPAGEPFIAPQYAGKKLAVDVAGAKKVLTDAGYTYNGDKLMGKNGQQVSFEMTDPAGWSDYLTQLQLVSSAVKQIGISATVSTPSVDAWTTNIQNGKFQAALHWTDSGATPYNMYSTMFDGVYNKPLGKKADWNFGRFENAASTKAFATYQNASDDATRKAALSTIQDTWVKEVPVIGMDIRPELGIYSTKSWVGWPSETEPYADPAPTGFNMSEIMMKLHAAS